MSRVAVEALSAPACRAPGGCSSPVHEVHEHALFAALDQSWAARFHGEMASTSVRDLFDRLTLGMIQTLGEASLLMRPRHAWCACSLVPCAPSPPSGTLCEQPLTSHGLQKRERALSMSTCASRSLRLPRTFPSGSLYVRQEPRRPPCLFILNAKRSCLDQQHRLFCRGAESSLAGRQTKCACQKTSRISC